MSRQRLKRWQDHISHIEARSIEGEKDTQFGDLDHSIIKDWSQGVLRIEVHFRIRKRFFSVKAGQYLASFDCPVRKESKVSSPHFSGQRNRPLRSDQTSRRRRGSAMLFPIVDRVYAPEVVNQRFLPAVVRLKSFKDSHGTRATSRKHLLGGSFPLAPSARERELNVFLFFPVTWARKGERKMVESRAQLIGNLTEKDAELWRKWCDFRDPQMIPPISVWLDRDSVEVRFAMGLGDCIGSLEVEVSPINLCSHKG